MSGRLRRELNDWCVGKVHMQLSGEQGQSQIMADMDIKVRGCGGGEGSTSSGGGSGSSTGGGGSSGGGGGGGSGSSGNALPAPRPPAATSRRGPPPQGSDWNAQLKLGNPGFYGLNYFQSITPALSMGGGRPGAALPAPCPLVALLLCRAPCLIPLRPRPKPSPPPLPLPPPPAPRRVLLSFGAA
jgi:hypothetical protein